MIQTSKIGVLALILIFFSSITVKFLLHQQNGIMLSLLDVAESF